MTYRPPFPPGFNKDVKLPPLEISEGPFTSLQLDRLQRLIEAEGGSWKDYLRYWERQGYYLLGTDIGELSPFIIYRWIKSSPRVAETQDEILYQSRT